MKLEMVWVSVYYIFLLSQVLFSQPRVLIEPGMEYQLYVFDVLGKLYYRENFFATSHIEFSF